MKELLELFTTAMNHLLKIYLGMIAHCLSIIEVFAHSQLKYTKLRMKCQLLQCAICLKNVI